MWKFLPNFSFVAAYSRRSSLEILILKDSTDTNRHFSQSKGQRNSPASMRANASPITCKQLANKAMKMCLAAVLKNGPYRETFFSFTRNALPETHGSDIARPLRSTRDRTL